MVPDIVLNYDGQFCCGVCINNLDVQLAAIFLVHGVEASLRKGRWSQDIIIAGPRVEDLYPKRHSEALLTLGRIAEACPAEVSKIDEIIWVHHRDGLRHVIHCRAFLHIEGVIFRNSVSVTNQIEDLVPGDFVHWPVVVGVAVTLLCSKQNRERNLMACVAGGLSQNAVNSVHGRHFVLLVDGRLGPSDKITRRGERAGTGPATTPPPRTPAP